MTKPKKSDKIPCSSNFVKNTEIESYTDTTDFTVLTNIRDIGLYINKRIFDIMV
jgi:hypothetical protein